MNFKFLPILLVVVLLIIFTDDAVGRSRRSRRGRSRRSSPSSSRRGSTRRRQRTRRSRSRRLTSRRRKRQWLPVNPQPQAEPEQIESTQGCEGGESQNQNSQSNNDYITNGEILLQHEYPDEDFSDFGDFMDKIAELREDDGMETTKTQIKKDLNDPKMDAIIDSLNDKLDDRVAVL